MYIYTYNDICSYISIHVYAVIITVFIFYLLVCLFVCLFIYLFTWLVRSLLFICSCIHLRVCLNLYLLNLPTYSRYMCTNTRYFGSCLQLLPAVLSRPLSHSKLAQCGNPGWPLHVSETTHGLQKLSTWHDALNGNKPVSQTAVGRCHTA